MERNLKVIAISGSPSKGFNSDSMLDAFLEGLSSVKDISFEKFNINDVPMNFYNYNNKMGPEADELAFKELTDKVQSANGLVIAAPTYNFGVPAQLKNFIDRIRFFALDFSKRNKLGQPVGKLDYLKTYYLVSGGTPNWAQKILFFAFPPFWLRGVFLYYGADCMGAIYSGDVKTFENKKILNKCKKEGRKYGIRLVKGKRHKITERIFWRPPQVN